MKIMLLGMTQFRYMPYMNFYLNQIDAAKHDVHIVTWNRDGSEDADLPKNLTRHEFNLEMMDYWPLKKKWPRLLRYRKYAKGVLKEVQPDFLIVHYSTTASLLLDELLGRFRGKYIFDFRDITYEKNFAFRKVVAKIVKGSALSFTSSDGFRPFLPESDKLLTSHNLNLLPGEVRSSPFHMKDLHSPIRIAFWGLIRGYDINKRLIEAFGGDERFELHYYGRAQGSLLELIKKSAESYANVYFHGVYQYKDIALFQENTDLIHNVYGDNLITHKYAMGNKLYDGLIYHIPLLCSKGSFMGELAADRKIGIEVLPEDNDLAETIFQYYSNIDRDSFDANCSRVLNDILNEIETDAERIRELLS